MGLTLHSECPLKIIDGQRKIAWLFDSLIDQATVSTNGTLRSFVKYGAKMLTAGFQRRASNLDCPVSASSRVARPIRSKRRGSP
jgi:hypothetical protein